MNLKPNNKVEATLAFCTAAWFLAVVGYTAPVTTPACSEAVEQASKAFLAHPMLELKQIEPKVAQQTKVQPVIVPTDWSLHTQSSYDCLVEGLAAEIRSGSDKAIQNVADVIVNRAQHNKFPDGICATIQQPKQFSYRNSGAPDPEWLLNIETTEKKALDKVKLIAENTLRNGSTNKDYLWYHTVDLKPKPAWTKSLKVAARDGYHVFYAER